MKPCLILRLVSFFCFALSANLGQIKAQDLTSQWTSGGFPASQEDYDFSLDGALPYLLKNSVSKNLTNEQQRAADRQLAATLDPSQIPAVARAARTLSQPSSKPTSQPTNAGVTLVQALASQALQNRGSENRTLPPTPTEAGKAAEMQASNSNTQSAGSHSTVPPAVKDAGNPPLIADSASPNFRSDPTQSSPQSPAGSTEQTKAPFETAGSNQASAPPNTEAELNQTTNRASNPPSSANRAPASPTPDSPASQTDPNTATPANSGTGSNAVANPPAPEEKVFKQNVRPIKPAIQIAGQSNASPVAPLNHGSAVVRLKSEASTNKTRFNLSDIADVQANSAGLKSRLENFEIGTINLGQEGLPISAKEVEEKLRYGFPQVQFSIQGKSSSLSYDALVLSAEEQKALVEDYIAKNDPDYANFEIEYLSPISNLSLPSLEPSYKLEAFGPSLKNSRFQNWKLSLYSQQVLFKQVWLRGRLKPPEAKPALAKLDKSTDPAKARAEQKEDRFSQFFKQQQAQTEAPTPTNKAVKESNQNSTFIFKTAKADGNDAKLMVEKNKPIELVYQGSKIELKVRAVALDAGNLGDYIRVKNLQSDSVVMARILSPLQVLINE